MLYVSSQNQEPIRYSRVRRGFYECPDDKLGNLMGTLSLTIHTVALSLSQQIANNTAGPDTISHVHLILLLNGCLPLEDIKDFH